MKEDLFLPKKAKEKLPTEVPSFRDNSSIWKSEWIQMRPFLVMSNTVKFTVEIISFQKCQFWVTKQL